MPPPRRRPRNTTSTGAPPRSHRPATGQATTRPRGERVAAAPPALTKTARAGNPVYIGHVVPGLERLATREVTAIAGNVEIIETLKQFDVRTSLLLFSYGGDASDLRRLTLFEDIFILIADRAGITGDRGALRTIQGLAGGSGLNAAVRVANPLLPGNRRKPTFRVIARKSGDHAYRRTDLRTAVERGVLTREPDWAPAEGARFEIWAQLVADRLIIGLRLTDETMRQRTYKLVNLPASLKPTVARAMVVLTHPHDDDLFLDPMCGAGTILLERAHAGRYARLEGGDLDHVAVNAALENFGTRHQPFRIREWDARELPFADGEVSAIACNLPFGKQIGSRADNQSLYPAVLKEWMRVLRPGGRMVLLTSESRLLRASLRGQEHIVWEQAFPVIVRGFPAEIFVVQKTG